MPKYLKIQEAAITDNITLDGHVGARLPWPVIADEDGTVVAPSSLLGMVQVLGFQRDLAKKQVDLWWKDAFPEPEQVIGMYVVAFYGVDRWQVGLSAVDTVEVLETDEPLPVER